MARPEVERKRPVRLSVSFTRKQHRELKDLAHRHDPPLTIQYIVQYAVTKLLDEAADSQMRLVFPPGRHKG